MIKFSCVCVTYGRNEYIGESIQSFLNQTYKNKELIILNTCPRQKYVFEHPLVKVINLKKRPKSLCKASHMGVLETSGDWIVPWDDDDVWLPEFLAQYATHINKDPSVGWVHTNGWYMANSTEIIDYHPTRKHNHLFTISRKLYDKVGGYINKGEWYYRDVNDLNLSHAMRRHRGMEIINSSYNSGMIYRFSGINYHHSSLESKTKSNYEVCGDFINNLLDEGKLQSGEIEIQPSEAYKWLDMAREKYIDYKDFYKFVKLGKPLDVYNEIRNTSWKQHINPITVDGISIGGEFNCVKTFNEYNTKDGHEYTVNGDVVEFDNHRLEFDEYGQMIGYNEKYGVGLRYTKIPQPTKSISPASKINLYVQVYNSENSDRQKELDDCLRINKSLDYLNVIEVPKQDRLSFSEMMDYIRPFSDENTISIFANSDIVFDETIKMSLCMSMGECFWLTRYESSFIDTDGNLNIENSYLCGNEESSDAWVFRGVLKKVPNIDFGFGIWGCDTAFSSRLRSAGYLVFNPCYSIKTYHIHSSNFRTNQFPQAPKPWEEVTHCKLPWNDSTPDKIISFSLYGNDKIYIDNAYKNIVDYKSKLGSDWKIHISFGDDVDKSHLNSLIGGIDSYDIYPATNDSTGMLWRGMVEADILLIRDIDAVLSKREVDSINEWINSPYPYCTFRDHTGHVNKLMGGLLSIKGRKNVSFINSLYRNELKSNPNGYHYGYDENFLSEKVYPLIVDKCIEFSSQGNPYKFAKYVILPIRETTNDVIGDGIGKYCGMNDIYSKTIHDNPFRLMKICKQWTGSISTKAWVSMGTIEDDYYDFYKPVSTMWNRFGYKTFLTLICDENSIERNEFGIILRIKKSDIEPVYDDIYDRSYSWQSQISRLYAASYINGLMITSDLDSIPLQNEYFDNLIDIARKNDTIAVSRKSPYKNIRKYCMMWTSADSKIYEHIFDSRVSFDEFCERYVNTNKVSFITDEEFLTDKIDSYNGNIEYMDNIPVNRICRTEWNYSKDDLRNGYYTDSHLLRPYKKYSLEINTLMHSL